MRKEIETLGGRAVRLDPGARVDAHIAAVADAQHGVIASAQLRRCGVGDSAISRRVTAGKLHRLHRGVYTPGHRRLPTLGLVAAAVLACGPGAVASHLTAAWLQALRADGRRLIDVSAGGLSGRRHGHVVTHSAGSLRPQDVEVIEGIPVTSVARTILDCAPILRRRGTEKLLQAGERTKALDLDAIRSLLAHVPGHPGTATVRAALSDLTRASGATASDYEEDLLLAARAAGLPEPECNAAIQRPDGSWAYADLLWRTERLIVEADSREYHDGTFSYRDDRRRDRALLRLGYETMRFSDQDMLDPSACVAEVAERLSSR